MTATTDGLFFDGKTYEWQMGRWSRIAGDIFLDWLDRPPGLRWLDVGCGNGAFTEALIARCAPQSVTAIDPSEGQLAYARTRPGARLADFRVGDAQVLPFADDSFDVATMALVITFIPDPAKALAELARVVRPGGWIATYMWDIMHGGSPFDPIYAAAESFGIARPLPPSAPASQRDTMQALWQAAGLRAVETRKIEVRFAYPNFNDFWGSNTAKGGMPGQLVSGLSSDLREKMRERLRSTLPTAADGSIAYDGYVNAVKGQVP